MQKRDYIRIRLSEKQKEEIKRISEHEDITMSQYILDLIRADIKKRRATESKGK